VSGTIADDTGKIIDLPPVIVRARKPVVRTPQQALRAPDPVQGPVEPETVYDLPIPDLVRPRAGLAINGQRMDDHLVSFEVQNNRFFTADSFNVVLALVERDPERGLPFWSDQGADGNMQVELFASLSDEQQPDQSLLAGRVDELRLDLARRTVTLIGRDHTADLIEAKIAEKFQNQTASQIVETLASRYGLTARATATSTLAGTYYKHEHANLNDETTAWNLITYLAEREGFDAYVKGKELYFGPPPEAGKAPVWVLQYEPSEGEGSVARAPATSIQFTRGLTASREVVVKVISWGRTKKKAITGTSRSQRSARTTTGQFARAATHTFRVAGLDQEQADREAERLHREITRNMRSFDAEIPGDPRLGIDTIVRVRGTGGSFDADYHLDELIRGFSRTQGLEMRLRGRNVVADDTASL
jgi:phage protein D